MRLISACIFALVVGSAVGTELTTSTTASPDLNLTSTPAVPVQKSAKLTVPGFGSVNLPSLSLPSLSVPSLPSLPKIFAEVGCVSLLSARTGICRSAATCEAASGLADGPCALGLGVCCTKPVSCGQTVIQKSAVIANPDWPQVTNSLKTGDVCTITVIKSLDTAQLRLDFERFDIAGPDATTGSCSEDVLTLTGGNAGTVRPAICGLAHGQHLIVPVDRTAPLSPIQITIRMARNSGYGRLFRLKVTQIGKNSPLLAPAHCSQYFTAPEGQVHSFNYETEKGVAIRRIRGLNYTVCFKPLPGHCSVRIEPTVGRRVVRSAQPSLPYGHSPQQRYTYLMPQQYNGLPAYRSYGPVAHRPVYLQPAYHKSLIAQPPAYQYVKYAEPKKDLIAEKKELVAETLGKAKTEVDGLLARKQLLIDELFGGIKLPSLPAITLPSLPSLPSLPAVPSVPSLPAVPSLPSLPSIPTLQDLLNKKEDVVKAIIAKKEEKIVPYAKYQQYNQYQKPAYLPPKKELIKGLIEEKKVLVDDVIARKQQLIDQLLNSLKVATPASGLPLLPTLNLPSLTSAPLTAVPSLQDLIAKKEDFIKALIAKKEKVVPYAKYQQYNGLPAYRSYGPIAHRPVYLQPAYHKSLIAQPPAYQYVKYAEPKKDLIAEKKELVAETLGKAKTEVDGLLARKQQLIDELLGGLKLPASLTLQDLLNKKEHFIKSVIAKKEEKVVPYAKNQQYNQYQKPAYLPPKKELIKGLIEEKKVLVDNVIARKQEVVDQLLNPINIATPASGLPLRSALTPSTLTTAPFAFTIQESGDLASMGNGFAVRYKQLPCA